MELNIEFPASTNQFSMDVEISDNITTEFVNAYIAEVNEHNKLILRDAANAHPISAITGLLEFLQKTITIDDEVVIDGNG